MKKNTLLGVQIQPLDIKKSLEKILLRLDEPGDFFHIVSLNPENMVIAQGSHRFRKVLSEGDIQLIDGIGIVLGGLVTGIEVKERITGVDFMKRLIELCNRRRLRVLFLGGKANLAEKLADRYRRLYPNSTFKGTFGISHIKDPSKAEEQKTLSIIADYKPQILFVAFGSPYQELWLDTHKDKLKGIICMGVGGSFDFLSGEVQRAPQYIQKLGLEWLFRLIVEPWRWKRQLNLIIYVYLVFKQKLGFY